MKAPIRIDDCTVAPQQVRPEQLQDRPRARPRWRRLSPAGGAGVPARPGSRGSPSGSRATSSAGTTPTQNITRQPSVDPLGVAERIREAAEEGIDVVERQRGQHVAPEPAALQQPRRQPAQPRRPLLEGQGHAGRPRAAHPDAEEGTECEEHRIRRREAAQEREQREPQDRQHQGQLPSPAVSHHARPQAAHQPEQSA